MLEESNARNLEQEILVGKTKILKGHTKNLISVLVKDNLIISGSLDKTIRIWDIDSGECLKTLKGHKDWVNSVFVKDNLIISGSWDNTINIWDINSCSCIKTLEGHRHWIESVFVKDNLIISGSDDETIRITPISLFPSELSVFQSTMNSCNLAHHLEREVMDYFGAM